jgi:hypothetical protein
MWPPSRRIQTVLVVVSAAVALASPRTGGAMTGKRVEMTCPYDGTKFTAVVAMSGTPFATGLDFRLAGPIASPPPLASCPTNGFVFVKESYSEEELERLRPLVLSPEYQALKDETPYYRAAWILDRSGAPRFNFAWTLLMATWESYEAPERYARYASEVIARLPEAIGSTKGEQKQRLQIVLGELLRRISRFDEAVRYLSQLSGEIDRLSNEGLIVAYEIELAANHDHGPHFVHEAIKNGEADPVAWRARHSPLLASGRLLTLERLFRFERGRKFVWSSTRRELIAESGDRLIAFDVVADRSTVLEPSLRKPYLVLPDGRTVNIGIDALPSYADLILAFDEQSALAMVDGQLVGYDLRGNELRQLPTPAFSRGSRRSWLKTADPTGPRVALLHDDSMIVWDYAQGTIVTELHPEGWTESMTSVGAAFGADGSRLFVAADNFRRQDCEVTTWDLRAGHPLGSRRIPAGTGARLAVSRDQRYAALACGETVTIWDYDLGEQVETMTLRGRMLPRAIAFSPDGRNLAIHIDGWRYDGALAVYSLAH